MNECTQRKLYIIGSGTHQAMLQFSFQSLHDHDLITNTSLTHTEITAIDAHGHVAMETFNLGNSFL